MRKIFIPLILVILLSVSVLALPDWPWTRNTTYVGEYGVKNASFIDTLTITSNGALIFSGGIFQNATWQGSVIDELYIDPDIARDSELIPDTNETTRVTALVTWNQTTNTRIDNFNTTAAIQALGFVTGGHTNDTTLSQEQVEDYVGAMVVSGAGISFVYSDVAGTITASLNSTFTSGYPNWNLAYSWGDHASAGYLTSASNLNASKINTGTVGDGFLSSNVVFESELSSGLATQDECSEITGCVENALTNNSALNGSKIGTGIVAEAYIDSTIARDSELIPDTNETTRFNTLVGNCTTGQVLKGVLSDGTRVCVTDQTGGGGGSQWPLNNSEIYNNSGTLSLNRTTYDALYLDDTYNTTAQMITAANTTGYLINWSGAVGGGNTTEEIRTAINGSSVTFSGVTSTGNVDVSGTTTLLNDLRFTESSNINYIQSGANRVSSSWQEIRIAPYLSSNYIFRIDADRDVEVSAHNFTVDTDVFHVDSADDNVGIGTTQPNSSLHVVSPSSIIAGFVGNGSESYISLIGGAANIGSSLILAEGGGIGGDGSTGARMWYEGNDNKLYISVTSGGGLNTKSNAAVTIPRTNKYVGINNTSPNVPLDVVGSVEFTSGTYTADGSELCTPSNGLCNQTDGNVTAQNGATSQIAYFNGANTLTSDSDFTWDGTDFNVGTNDVNSNQIFKIGSGGTFQIGRNANEYLNITQDASSIDLTTYGKSFNVGTSDTQSLNFQTSGTTRMTVTASNGYVGIGTPSAVAELHVTSTDNTDGIVFDSASDQLQYIIFRESGSNILSLLYNGTGSNAANFLSIRDATNGVDRVRFYRDGNTTFYSPVTHDANVSLGDNNALVFGDGGVSNDLSIYFDGATSRTHIGYGLSDIQEWRSDTSIFKVEPRVADNVWQAWGNAGAGTDFSCRWVGASNVFECRHGSTSVLSMNSTHTDFESQTLLSGSSQVCTQANGLCNQTDTDTTYTADDIGLNLTGTVFGINFPTDCSDESQTLLWNPTTGFSCGADAGAGGGMTSWTLSNGTATATVSDGERVNITGGTGIYVSQNNEQIVIENLVTDTDTWNTTEQMRLAINGSSSNFSDVTVEERISAKHLLLENASNARIKLNSTTSGDAYIDIIADSDNSNDNDNPYIYMESDGGATGAFIGQAVASFRGDGTAVTDVLGNALLIQNWWDSTAADVQIATRGAVRATFSGEGRLGIGTNQPLEELDIVASEPRLRLQTTDNNAAPGIEIANSSSTNGWILFQDTGTNFADKNDLIFYYAPSAAARYVFGGDGTMTAGSSTVCTQANGLCNQTDTYNTTAQIRTAINGSSSNFNDIVVGDYDGTDVAPIDIEANANNFAIQIEENGAGTESWQLGVDTDGDLGFHDTASATASVTFQDVTGNVGIGTANPFVKLHVVGQGNFTQGILSQDWSNVTITESQISDLTHTTTLALKDITGYNTTQCSGTDKVTNVTFNNGNLEVTCGTDQTGAGGGDSNNAAGWSNETVTTHTTTALDVRVESATPEIELHDTDSPSNSNWSISTASNGQLFYITSPNGANLVNLNRDTGGATIQNLIAPASFSGAIGLLVQGASGQTANLQTWENSGGTDLSWVNGTGYMFELGSRVCTPENGLCNNSIGGGDSTGGWTNNTENTTTLLEVGIGTEFPNETLHIVAKSGEEGLRVRQDGTSRAVTIDNNADNYALKVDHSGQSDGVNFACDTNNNHTCLGVTANNEQLSTVKITNLNPDATAAVLFLNGNSTARPGNIMNILSQGTGDAIEVNTNEFVVDKDGEVGIGIANPVKDLHIDGGSSQASLLINSTGTGVTSAQVVLRCGDDFRGCGVYYDNVESAQQQVWYAGKMYNTDNFGIGYFADKLQDIEGGASDPARNTVAQFQFTTSGTMTIGGSTVCTQANGLCNQSLVGYLQNVVEDTTPQLGGELDAQGNNIIDLADITFRTGATGGTLRTGTSAADKFELQAYDVDGAAYVKVLEVDAGNTPTLEVFADSFAVWDNADETKQLFFTLSGGATGTTTELIHSPTANRQITFPDASGTLLLATSSLNTSKLSQIGASTGEVLKWNGSHWDPGTDSTGAGGDSNNAAGWSNQTVTTHTTTDLDVRVESATPEIELHDSDAPSNGNWSIQTASNGQLFYITTPNSANSLIGNRDTAGWTIQNAIALASFSGTQALVVRGASGQTSHLQLWEHNNGTDISWVNGTGYIFDHNSRVCTPANGLCNNSISGGDSTGGWTNTSTDTNTSLFVNLNTPASVASAGNAPLRIRSGTDARAGSVEENTGGESWQFGVDSAGDWNWYDSGSTTPTISFQDATSNVGIGTDNPFVKLHVIGLANFTGNITMNGSKVCTAKNGLCNVTDTYNTSAQMVAAVDAAYPNLDTDSTNDYTVGGTDVALADGGTGNTLTDPNADRIMFWDDSAGVVTWLTPSTGLTISTTSMTVRSASTSQTGIIEIATAAEVAANTDTVRAITPSSLSSIDTLGTITTGVWQGTQIADAYVSDTLTASNLVAGSEVVSDAEVVDTITISSGGSVNLTALTQEGASTGQVVKWNGTHWAPGTDNTGAGGGDSNNAAGWTNETVTTRTTSDLIVRIESATPELELHDSDAPSNSNWSVSTASNGQLFYITSPNNANLLIANRDTAGLTLQNAIGIASYGGTYGLLARGASSQTADIFVVENSGGTDYFRINGTGTTEVLRNMTVVGYVNVTPNADECLLSGPYGCAIKQNSTHTTLI